MYGRLVGHSSAISNDFNNGALCHLCCIVSHVDDTTYPQRSWIGVRGPTMGPQGPYRGPIGNSWIFGIFGIFPIFNWVLGLKTYSKLFLELLPSFWVPGKPGFVLPGSFRCQVSSKIQFPNSPAPDSNPIGPFRAFTDAFPMKRTSTDPSKPVLTPHYVMK